MGALFFVTGIIALVLFSGSGFFAGEKKKPDNDFGPLPYDPVIEYQVESEVQHRMATCTMNGYCDLNEYKIQWAIKRDYPDFTSHMVYWQTEDVITYYMLKQQGLSMRLKNYRGIPYERYCSEEFKVGYKEPEVVPEGSVKLCYSTETDTLPCICFANLVFPDYILHRHDGDYKIGYQLYQTDDTVGQEDIIEEFGMNGQEIEDIYGKDSELYSSFWSKMYALPVLALKVYEMVPPKYRMSMRDAVYKYKLIDKYEKDVKYLSQYDETPIDSSVVYTFKMFEKIYQKYEDDHYDFCVADTSKPYNEYRIKTTLPEGAEVMYEDDEESEILRLSEVYGQYKQYLNGIDWRIKERQKMQMT